MSCASEISNESSSDEDAKKGRKRKRNPDNWNRNVIKRKRAEGKAYVNKRGIPIGPRILGPPCVCRKKCFDTIESPDVIIDNFNKIANKDLQDSYLFGLITRSEIQRRRKRNVEKSKPKQATFTYKVRTEGREIVICQKAFISVHGISKNRLLRLTTHLCKHATPPQDMRGIHLNRPHAVAEEIKWEISHFINLIPTRLSHYSRFSQKKKRYFSKDITSVRQLHRMYVQKYENLEREEPDQDEILEITGSTPGRPTASRPILPPEPLDTGTADLPSEESDTALPPDGLDTADSSSEELDTARLPSPDTPSSTRTSKISYQFFREYFITEHNIGFGRPRSDTCGTCDNLRMKIEVENNPEKTLILEREKEMHLRKAECFYAKLREANELARSDPTVETLCFDFQQNLPLPHLPVGDLFYARQLWVFNFGIHVGSTNAGFMYMWPEGDAKRGVNEVITCLDEFLKNRLSSRVKTLYLFSDACAGQNRNSTMMQYLYSVVKLRALSTITHVFPTRGHSYLPCDRDFALIEKQKRKVDTVVKIDEWFKIVEISRPRQPFVVVKVKTSDVLDYKTHFNKHFKKNVTNKNREKLSFLTTKIFRYCKSKPNTVAISESTATPIWKRFIIEKNNQLLCFPPSTMKAYQSVLPIKESKAKDIMTIVEKYLTPTDQKWYADRCIEAHHTETEDADKSDESEDSEAHSEDSE